MLPVSLNSRPLCRLLLSLVIRLRSSVARVALVLRAWIASIWKLILPFTGRSEQSRLQLYSANDVPAIRDADKPTGEERLQAPQDEKVDPGQARGTLATLPVGGTVWGDEFNLAVSRRQFEFRGVPATPEGGSQRYKPRTMKVSTEQVLDLPAGQHKLLSALPLLPDGWRRRVHPEGNVFFYHKRLRVFTENDVSDPNMEEEVRSRAETLIRDAIERSDDVTLDKLTELVLNVDDEQRCYYYFVDHTNRLLFWVASISAKDIGADLQGLKDYSHIRYFIEAQYWNIVYDIVSRSHCEYYPHDRTIPKGVIADLRGMLNYTKTDMMTTDSSPSPFAQDELVAILDLVNSLKDDEEISDPYSTWVIARLMAFFTENKFLNFCGQACARLNADTPLFEKQTWNRHILFKRVWVDGIIIQPRWKDFTNRLTTELGRYTIFSTLMLNVNFSFLSVHNALTPGRAASSVQIIIYCSVVSTIASIVFSFVLLNFYNDPGLMVADIAAETMRTLSQSNTGMARLAIMHSLPISCLIWSIALFSVALAIQIFGAKELELATTASIGTECLVLVLLTGMSMRVMWHFSRGVNSVEDNRVDGSAGKLEGEARPHAGTAV